MAKLPGFTADLGYMNAPAAPNPAVVEAAYAAEARGLEARAKGIEIAAAKRGEAVGALAKLAETGYTMKVEQDARTAVQDVVNKLNTPEFGFVGENAASAQRLGQEAMGELQNQQQDMGEFASSESVFKYMAKAQQIQANVQQNMLSQAQAQTILASDMKRLIAENPMMADRIRKVYNSHTGRGDWDVRPVETALTAKAKEDEAQKVMMRLLESDAKKIFDSGVGNNFGMKSSAEIFQHLVQRTDIGARMTTAVQANALVQETNKAMTTGDMNTFFSNAYVGAQAARVETNTRLQQALLAQGLDLSKPLPQLTEAHRALITNAYVQAKQAERNALEGARVMLTDRLRANPSLDSSIVSATIEKLDKQIANTPTTASFEDMLNTLKMDSTARNVNAQTLLVSQQVRDMSLKTTWGDSLINMAKDPANQEELLRLYPGNSAVLAFVNEFRTRQGSFSEDIRRHSMIADGMNNPNAPMEHRAAYEAAKTTPEGRRQIAAITQLNMGQGAAVLTRGNTQTASDVTNIIVLGRNFVPEGSNFNALQTSITTGAWEKMFPTADAKAKEMFVKDTTGRIATWLNGNDPNSYLTALKNTVANIPGATMSVQNGALIVSPPAGADPVAVIAMNGQLNIVNSLIRMQNTLLKRDDIASTLITAASSQLEAGAPTQPPTAPITPGQANVREGVIRQGGQPYNLAPRNPLATQGGPAIPAGSEEEMARRAAAAREINTARTGGVNAPTPSMVNTTTNTTPWWRSQ
jgi:Holliday junction resolvasome RuvABC DNA-binding subunit